MSGDLLSLLALGGGGGAGDDEPQGFGARLQAALQSPTMGLAAGLLSAAGPSQEPVSIGQGLAQGLQLASGLQRSQLENRAAREALSERAQQRDARARLREGLLGEVGERERMGLLFDAAPEAVTAGVAGQMFPEARREPAIIQTLRAIGVDPRSEEGREIALESLREANAGDEVLRAVQLQLAALDLQERRTERAREETTREKQRTGLRQSIRRGLGQVEKLADLNRELQGTFLEAGLPLTELRRMGAGAFSAALAAAGQDRSEIDRQVAKFDTFRKGLNDLVIGTIDRFGNTITNQQLQLLENASANPEISPAAIADILAGIAEINLEQADREGFEVEGRGGVQRLIERERSFGLEEPEAPERAAPRAREARRQQPAAAEPASTGARTRRAPRPAEIARMRREQLEQLDPAQLSDAALEAAARRAEQLR